MKRKIYQRLLDWKNNSQGKTALLIEGARRVGKSYIVEEFAKKEYESFALIDFNRAQGQIPLLFDTYLYDLDSFFFYLSALLHVHLRPRKSLIIFDEVQAFPRARSAIKYLVQDGRFDYIETGSLLSIKKNVEGILLPSEERHLKMYPMDFEEFLWSLGELQLMDLLRDCFSKLRPLGQTMHRKIMDLFRQYLLVGGMPQAVETYVKTKNFAKVYETQKDILDLYRSDINKNADSDKRKVERILEELPSQLSRHEKRFRLSSLASGARYRDYESAFYWLDDSMIINSAYNSTLPGDGLAMNMDSSLFKCYMGDTGLLINLSLNDSPFDRETLYNKILFDKLSINEGMIMENAVAQALVGNGRKLYFYSRNSKQREERMEIDFLIDKRELTSRHNICPIEVKSTGNYTLNSLKKFQAKYQNELATPYVIHASDLKVQDGVVYLPLYMAGLL